MSEPPPLLTDDEREIVTDLGRIYVRLSKVVGPGTTRGADLTELGHHIHVLQQAVMAQAAARAFPTEFRLLGEECVIPS
jgi:hypothetical protein